MKKAKGTFDGPVPKSTGAEDGPSPRDSKHRRQAVDAMQALREKAERFLAESRPSSSAAFVADDLPRLLHELQVYQAELELQNGELREAHEALERSRDHYQRLFKDAPIAYFLLDARGVILKANQCGCQLLGRNEEKLQLFPFVLFLLEQDRMPFSATHLQRPDPNGGIRTSEVRLSLPSRPGVFARLESSRWPGEGGDDGILLAAVDITEQKKSLRALQDSEARFRLLFENSRDAIIISDEQQKVLQANRAAESLFQRGFGELFERSLSELMEQPPAPLGKDAAPANETVIHLPNRESRCVEYLGSPFAPGLQLWILRDVTRRHEEQEALRAAKEAAEVSDRVKTEFLNNISHELRTPMNAILGMTELLRFTKVDEEQREFIDQAYAAGEQLLKLINDIIDLARLEGDEGGVEPYPFRLAEIVDHLGQWLRNTWKESPVIFSLTVDPDLPEEVIGDLVRLRQALGYILANARKFTEKGEISMRVTPLERLGESMMIRFEICDTGVGMAKEDIDRLFKPFAIGDGSSTRKFGGLGIGLAICRKLVERMKGSITVESTPGQGTRFRIDVPLVVVLPPTRGSGGSPRS